MILIWRNVLPPILNNFQLRFTELSCCTRRQIREAATRKADARSDIIISLSSPKRAGIAWHVATRSTNLFVATLPYLFARHYAIRIRMSNRVTSRHVCYTRWFRTWKCRGIDIERCIGERGIRNDSSRKTQTHRHTYLHSKMPAGLSSSLSLSRAGAVLPRLHGMANLKSNSRTPRKFLPEINPPITSPRSLHVKWEIKILLSSWARVCFPTCKIV